MLYNLGAARHRMGPAAVAAPAPHAGDGVLAVRAGPAAATRALQVFAKKMAMTPAQVAIAWLLAQDGVIAIPKTGKRERLEESAGALQHPLSRAQLAELDQLFPPPRGPTPLAVI